MSLVKILLYLSLILISCKKQSKIILTSLNNEIDSLYFAIDTFGDRSIDEKFLGNLIKVKLSNYVNNVFQLKNENNISYYLFYYINGEKKITKLKLNKLNTDTIIYLENYRIYNPKIVIEKDNEDIVFTMIEINNFKKNIAETFEYELRNKIDTLSVVPFVVKDLDSVKIKVKSKKIKDGNFKLKNEFLININSEDFFIIKI